jgi:hypothetical protein
VYELKTTLQVYGMVSHLTFGTAAKHIVYNRTNHMAGGGGGGGAKRDKVLAFGVSSVELSGYATAVFLGWICLFTPISEIFIPFPPQSIPISQCLYVGYISHKIYTLYFI